jgi:hypothetical protein
MLVDNNFIFLNLPRCASSSFQNTCLYYNLPLDFYDDSVSKIIKSKQENDIAHYHESLILLQTKFGKDYPVISVKRDPKECFISMWKHIINFLYKNGLKNEAEQFTNLKINDILTYSSHDTMTPENRSKYIYEFLKKTGITRNMVNENFLSLLNTLLIPVSNFHNDNQSIIWFKFNELHKLEDWVSNRLNIDFKLQHLNSSNHLECELKNDENFRKVYDSIYGHLNNPKIEITLL